MRRVYCEAINDLRGTAAPTRKDPTMELLRTHEPLEAFVFDMDGTLLDSLPDLVDVTNETLTHFGYPTHTTEEILAMIGNGLRSLILQALPQGLNDNATEAALAWWKARYDEVGNQKTTVYDGMLDTLAELKARGMKLAVLSNKYDGGVQILTKHYFADLMDFALGDGPVPRKPDPKGLTLVAKTLGVPVERVAYVGDSDVDMQVANNAGAFPIGAKWGYQTLDHLTGNNPGALIDAPAELLKFAE